MSHLSRIETEITDLSTLKKAVKRLGGELKEGQKSFTWYRNQMGNCDHAIKFPEASYEIGVTKVEKKFELTCDYYYVGGLPKYIGETGGLLSQAYGIEAAKKAALLQGHTVTEKTLSNGKVQLKIAVNE